MCLSLFQSVILYMKVAEKIESFKMVTLTKDAFYAY